MNSSKLKNKDRSLEQTYRTLFKSRLNDPINYHSAVSIFYLNWLDWSPTKFSKNLKHYKEIGSYLEDRRRFIFPKIKLNQNSRTYLINEASKIILLVYKG